MTKCLFALAVLMPTVILAQAPHRSGSLHTPEVDLGYEVLGAPSAEIPLFAVNGGPGLSHAYMMQNDLWSRIGKSRLVVLYDQRGTGGSKRMPAGASQTGVSQSMDSQVADLDAIRQTLSLTKFALLGDSYGGLVAMAYAAAHPEHVAKLILSDSPGPSWHD